ncbi:MAG: LPS export ABC transporter permease LptF [Thermoanaerobaculia bacterium]
MRLFRTLDRYVLAEIAGPLGLGFLIYTFIFLINLLFRLTRLVIQQDVPIADVGLLIFYSLPNIVVLTIPMALLFGILVAVGRLAADSELVALRASGVSLFSLWRPVALLSLLLALVNGVMTLWALPLGNHAFQHLNFRILTRGVTQQVEPRVFFEDWEGLIVYVFDRVPGDPRWHGVFVAEDLPRTQNQVTTAEWGEVRFDEASDTLVLRLENALTHEVNFNDPGDYRVSTYDEVERPLQEGFMREREREIKVSKSLREQTLPELLERTEEPDLLPEIRRLTWVEIHKKFSIPVACLVFGLLALPLGYNIQRGGGRSTGFALSVPVILVYWIMISNGEEAARVGKISPWMAMWLPNIALGGLGFFLLWRRNRDRSLLLGPDRPLAALARRLLRTPRARPAGGGRAPRDRRPTAWTDASGTGIVLRLPRLRWRFPNLLDRYVVTLFLKVFLFVQLSLLTVSIVADLTQRLDDMLQNQVGAEVVFDYYKYVSLQMFYDVAPIAVLLTTLITFGLLSRSNEVVAAKALGVSLYRLALPAALAALLVAGVAALLQARVLPASNQKVGKLKDVIRGRVGARTYRRADRQWLFGQGRYIYNYLRYDHDTKSLDRLQVFEFAPDDFSIRRRLFASEARFAGNAWVFESGWARSFEGRQLLDFKRFDEPVIDAYPETPDYFESELKLPEGMNYGELEQYIDEVESSGQRVPELRVELYKKVAFPVVCFVMALVALPFSFQLGRRGALYGVGIGVVLGMAFFALFAFFSTLGEAGALPAWIAVWTPNVTFALCSLYLFLGVRT